MLILTIIFSIFGAFLWAMLVSKNKKVQYWGAGLLLISILAISIIVVNLCSSVEKLEKQIDTACIVPTDSAYALDVSSEVYIPVIRETAEVPEPIFVDAPAVVKEKPPRYIFTENDIYLMARLLCGSKYVDGDGEYDFDYGNEDRLDQINVVLSVVMNRVQDERFPDTVEDVILQKYHGQDYQFSAVSLWQDDNGEVSDIALKRVEEWCYAYANDLKGVQAVPEDYVYFSANGKGINIARRDL